MAHARHVIESWRIEYNAQRPNSWLGDLTPEEFAKTGLPRREGARLLIDNPPWPRRLSMHEKD